MAKEKVETYFGDIPSGPPVERQASWIAKRTEEHRLTLQDRVSQPRIYKAWNIPEWHSAEVDYLDLVSDILTTGKNSRLYKRLVYDDQIATDVAGFAYGRELGGLFIVWATAQPGQDLAVVERALDEEMQRFLKSGPTPQELQRIKTQYRASFVRGVERIGGFGGKSDILAMNEVYGGSPDFYKVSLDRVAQVSSDTLQATARKWLSDGDFVLEVHPFPDFGTLDASARLRVRCHTVLRRGTVLAGDSKRGKELACSGYPTISGPRGQIEYRQTQTNTDKHKYYTGGA